MRGTIDFPSWSLGCSELFSSEIILVAGGNPPKASWLREVCRFREAWGVDRGCEVLLDLELPILGATGDFDSLSVGGKQALKQLGLSPKSYEVDKNNTDLELALLEVSGAYSDANFWVTGGFGGRFDHSLGNLLACQNVDRCYGLVDDREALIFVRPNQPICVQFSKAPKGVSIISLAAKMSGAVLTGCHWDLPKSEWNYLELPSISNRLAEGSHEVTLSVKSGVGALYFFYEEPNLR